MTGGEMARKLSEDVAKEIAAANAETREVIARELEAEARLHDGPESRLILQMAGLVRGKKP